MRRLALFATSAALLLLAPVEARASIDDDWALIDNCRKLAAFTAKYGTGHRYARFVPARSRKLGCTTSAANPTPRRQTATPDPQPPRIPRPPRETAPPLRSEIVLANSGGDASTLARALRMVRPGGLIKVRPGRYSISGDIGMPVRIEGEVGRWRETIFTGSLRVTGGGDEVRMANLTFQAAAPGNFIRIFGSFRCNACSLRPGSPKASNLLETDAIMVDAGGRMHLYQTLVAMTGACPGTNCYVISIAPRAGASTIVKSDIEHSTLGIFVSGGTLNVANSRFIGQEGMAISHNPPAGTLSVSDSAFSVLGNHRYYTISSRDRSRLSIVRSTFTSSRTDSHLYIEGKGIPDVRTFPGGNVALR